MTNIDWEARATAAEAQLARAREALGPFAAISPAIWGYIIGKLASHKLSVLGRVDEREAHAALEAAKAMATAQPRAREALRSIPAPADGLTDDMLGRHCFPGVVPPQNIGQGLSEDEDSVLPCDVAIAPATVIRKGCKVSTLMLAIRQREGRDVGKISDAALALTAQEKTDG